jgi:prophage maintenance system killer protein
VLDLRVIEGSLRRVQRDFAQINERLSPPREPMDDSVIRNMVAGYALVDALAAERVDLFAMGNLKYWLELNTTVLCGTDPTERAEYARHRQTTEQRFYEEQDGGIRDLVEWYQGRGGESVWMRAAGLYVRLLSRPQLFVEGNHRTGALAVSYVLLNGNEPPFVLTPDNATAYFTPSTVIKNTEKQGLAMRFRSPGLTRQVAGFLTGHADRKYLLPG